MLIKLIILLFLLTILYSLASSFFFLVKDKGQGDRTVQRLTWRVGLSLVLFLLLWGAHSLGWIEPNSGPVKPPVKSEASG
ncbi:MAG: twin transmembrane helix small protein [Xanthomonadales bacterium]|nr:twin transmembrane helix small protein [Xanthomonadales bacterium]